MEIAPPETLSIDEINEIDDNRIQAMNEAGIVEEEVLKSARENLNNWNNYFNENLTRGKDDMNFVLRDQWTAIERSEFNRLFKPAMTFNKLYDATKKIAGEQRKNKPDLLVRSLTGKATQEQIDLRADLVRTISYQSQNDLVYQTAFKSALMMGYGAFQVGIDYESPRSFNQIIKFNLIPDATRTAFDPTAVKPHKGDGNWCSRNYVFSKEEFAATYPYIRNPISYSDPRTLLDFQWETRDTIVVCDYFKKEWYPLLVYKLSTGETVTEDEWKSMQKQLKIMHELSEGSKIRQLIQKEIPKIVAKRQTQDYRVMHYRMIQNQLIEFSEWPSRQLPIIFVDGDSHFIEGRQYTRSFIHEARDAQKFINYVGSEVAAEIKNRRREQWIGTPDNIIGNEQMWRNPELQNGILIAKADPKTGQMPQKMPPWELSQTLLLQYQRGTMDIKEILGFHEELEGSESNAQSGVAIANRQIAGSMSAYVFFDNLNQAIEQAGRVVLDLLPSIYGGDERHVVISKADGKTKSLILNKEQDDGTVMNDMSPGEYDIEIDTGPSFAVQKQMALQMLQQMLQAEQSPAFNLVADLWASQLDLQMMPMIKERLQTLVPPAILAKENGQPPPPPPPPSPEQQMAQQEMQMKQGQMQERQQDLQMRQQKHELDKIDMAIRARELQAKLQSEPADRALEVHKADLDFSAKLAKIVSDLHHGEKEREVKREQMNQATNAPNQ